MSQVKGDGGNDDGVVGTSNVAGKSGVFGYNGQAGGNGVAGISGAGNGVFAKSDSLNGVFGESTSGSGVHGHSVNQIGVLGRSDKGDGIVGTSKSSSKSAVFGSNEATDQATAPGGSGVFGLTMARNAAGVFGANNSAPSTTNGGRGVQGNGPNAGVGGYSSAGSGVIGQSQKGSGVLCTSESGQGLTSYSDNDVGLFAQGGQFAGVFNGAVVVNKGPSPKDTGIPPKDINGSLVVNDGNLFINKGDIHVSGNVSAGGDIFLTNADFAEDFDVLGGLCEPGTVMVLAKNGALSPSSSAYDKKVAGVLSGAGKYKPAIVLDRHQHNRQQDRQPLAMIGKVVCKVDANISSIEVGDLLTTSDVSGHAMKATDPNKAFGAVIGKALEPLDRGQGLIAVLVCLQ